MEKDIYVVDYKIITFKDGSKHKLFKDGRHYELPYGYIDKTPRTINLKQQTKLRNIK